MSVPAIAAGGTTGEVTMATAAAANGGLMIVGLTIEGMAGVVRGVVQIGALAANANSDAVGWPAAGRLSAAGS